MDRYCVMMYCIIIIDGEEEDRLYLISLNGSF